MSDAELIQAALDATEGMSQTKAAEFLGVAQKTVSRWRNGDRSDLWPETRQKLEQALGLSPNGDGSPSQDLRRRLDVIDALDVSETLRVLRIEAVAAAYRAEVQIREAAAAEVRARAVERAEMNAETRAKAIERAEESAHARAQALRKEGPGLEIIRADEFDRRLISRLRELFGQQPPPEPPTDPGLGDDTQPDQP